MGAATRLRSRVAAVLRMNTHVRNSLDTYSTSSAVFLVGCVTRQSILEA